MSITYDDEWTVDTVSRMGAVPVNSCLRRALVTFHVQLPLSHVQGGQLFMCRCVPLVCESVHRVRQHLHTWMTIGRGASSLPDWGRAGMLSSFGRLTVVKQMLYSWIMLGYRLLKSSSSTNLL